MSHNQQRNVFPLTCINAEVHSAPEPQIRGRRQGWKVDRLDTVTATFGLRDSNSSKSLLDQFWQHIKVSTSTFSAVGWQPGWLHCTC